MRAAILLGAVLVPSTFDARAQDVLQYGRECQAAVADIPAFSCGAGTPIPITVDGQTPAAYTPGMRCDRPSLLPPEPGQVTDGQCVPYSRAVVLRDDNVAQISAFCRRKIIRAAG